jgi:hypothetical protein
MRMWWVWLFPLIGVGLLIGSAFAWMQAKRFVETAHRVIGEVVNYSEHDSTDDDGKTTHMYTPVIRFATADGTSVEKANDISSSRREYQLGQRVKVLYNPENPEEFKLDTVAQLYFTPGILAFLGIVFTIVGAIVVMLFASPKTELVDTPPELLHEDAD